MNMVKRGLIALSVVAAVGGTTGGLLASAASASPTRGPEVIHITQYSVAGGFGVGPWSGRGVIHNHGNTTDDPSLTTDPAGSSRHTVVDPAGSFTVLATGGAPGNFHMNPVTCSFSGTIKGITAKIVSGTGAYAKATGTLKANGVARGYLLRTATGCDTNQNDPSAFETDSTVAIGFINLH